MIRFSRAAADDLVGIRSWLQPRAGATIADSVIDQIMDAIQRLERFPEAGRPGRTPETRELVVGRLPYVAFYRIAGDDVIIRRVLHGAMRWPRSDDAPSG